MFAAWLTYPLSLDGSRDFTCDGFTPEQCAYYMQRFHFWYIADHVFALSTVAFFMCAIGIFIIGRTVSLSLGSRTFRGPQGLQKPIALIRYLSYRGFHLKALRWNSAPIGILLLGLVGAVYFFCMELIPQPYYWADEMYGHSPPLATRSGWLSLACMPFVFATASKTNWITLLAGISHERIQVAHRWISYAFFVTALMHTFPFIVYHIHWKDMESHFAESLLFYWTGIVALTFQAWLTFASHSTMRKFGYEFFKATHFLAVAVFMVTFFWHCDYILTSWDYFVATAAIYVPCYVYPWLRTCFEHGVGKKALITVESNGFTKITIPSKSGWKPGQHCFLRFTSLGIMQATSSHPFSICSLPSDKSEDQCDLVFYLRHQRGFTAKLYQYAVDHPGKAVSVLVDGPYGGADPKASDADHLLVIAGGVGAGWCLPLIEMFARRHLSAVHRRDSENVHNEKEISTAMPSPVSLHVVLATREITTRAWFLQTTSELLSKYPATASSSNIRIEVYVTGEAAEIADPPSTDSGALASSKESPPSTEEIAVSEDGHKVTAPGKEYTGRPHLPLVVREEAAKAAELGRCLSVFVCGPDTMQNDVRNAVAWENLSILRGTKAGGVYLHSEHFSWA